jgi:hypothetical protein
MFYLISALLFARCGVCGCSADTNPYSKHTFHDTAILAVEFFTCPRNGCADKSVRWLSFVDIVLMIIYVLLTLYYSRR